MAKQLYEPAAIEPKWQAFWAERRVFRTPNPGDPDFDAGKPKFYALDMFPYPSATGLHVGHTEGYTATDILVRYKRMKGFNVLHPMGWDAFGLPAEQYAIHSGKHPAATTRANIDNFRRQLQMLGFSYDWSRELTTSDPAYFRWTQWIFKKLHERGLAYQSDAPVWWCEALGTVLSNDEVVNGRSERGNHPCERRPLRQWLLKITDYAARLLVDLDELEWPESLKAMQREWIGQSRGAEIDFAVEGHPGTVIRVFTTRPDTLFGASFMVVAPEHPLLGRITTPAQRDAVQAYVRAAAAKSELERTDLAKDKTGGPTGAFARNPLFAASDPRGRLPVLVADYVIPTYGTGAIMAVPAGDARDFEFAQALDLPVPPIFAPSTGDADADRAVREGRRCWSDEAPYINSRNNQGLDLSGLSRAAAIEAVVNWLEAHGAGRHKVTYKLRDWLFSRQRYWGEPFPVLHREDGSVELVPDDQLPVGLPDMDDFRPGGSPESPLARATAWVETRDAHGRPARREINTMPGAAGSSWYFIRFCDPGNSREYCSKAASDYWMPVDLYVGGTEHAVGHLLYARFWTKVLHDLGLVHCKEPFRKLYNQGMIQSFAYQDARGAVVPMAKAKEVNEPVAIQETASAVLQDVESRKTRFVHAETGAPLTQIVTKMSKRYGNVVNPDDVVGEYGADTLRLYEMYLGPLADAKPWNPKDVPGVHRFLHRAWRLVVPERPEDGTVHAHLRRDRAKDRAEGRAKDGAKGRAKRPAKDRAKDRAKDQAKGPARDQAKDRAPDRANAPELERSLQRAINKVEGDIERLAFNTAIAAMMIFVNDATKAKDALSRDQALRFVKILSPFAPHLAEELWHRLGQEELLTHAPWPAVDPIMLAAESIEIAVQVLGKLRGRVRVPAEAGDAEVVAAARDAVAADLGGKTVVKEIVVKGRLVNFVVR